MPRRSGRRAARWSRRPGVHVVAPGETLHSIARLYGKPVMVLAKANNIPPDTMVKVGERIIIPDMREAPQPATIAPRAEAPAAAPGRADDRHAESPHSARLAAPDRAAGAGQRGQDRGAGRRTADLPLAGARPRHRRLRTEAEWLAERRHQSRGARRHAGQGGRGWRRRLCRQRAEGLRQSGAGAPRNGFVTAYAHASEILVKRGESVKRGQVIAHSGQTGNVTSPQLHFEIRKGATPVDPAQYLNGA